MTGGTAIRFRMALMIRFLLSRIGCLMVLIGSILLVLGIAAEHSGYSALNYVLIGIGLTILGFFLWNRLRKKRRSTRFSLFRRRKRDEEEDQEDEWYD